MHLTQYIEQHPKADAILDQHGLKGLFFVHSQLKKVLDLEGSYLKQWHLNQILLNQFDLISSLAAKEHISCIPLKGIFLIKTIYEDIGLRKMSDIDILTNNIKSLSQILINNHFQCVEQSNYKTVFTKIVHDQEVVVELHSQLYRDQNFNLELDQTGLSLREHLYFLIYHLSYQHTFIRLNWLYDLYYFYQKHPTLFNEVLSLSYKRGHSNSFLITFYFLNQFMDLRLLDKNPYQYLLKSYDLNFLINPNSNFFKYHVLKILTKKNLKDALNYNLKWVLNDL